MNREIKFRAKQIDTNLWVYGDLKYDAQKTFIGFNEIVGDDFYGDCIYCEIEVIIETIGQYIGLKDKNGKEIYEGDIVQCIMKNGYSEELSNYYIKNPLIVKFQNGEFYPNYNTCECEDRYYSHQIIEMNVIGNIYENPELLGN